MKRFFIAIGFLLLLAGSAGTVHAATLFERIQRRVEEEQDVPQAVAEFTAKVLNEDITSFPRLRPLSLTAGEVTAVLKTTLEGVLCAKRATWMTWDCLEVEKAIRRVGNRELETISLGRRLQIAATGYEDPIATFSLQPSKLTSAYLETLKVWGIPLVTSGEAKQTIRILQPPPEANEYLSAIVDDLSPLSTEEQVAAVWRYQYGVEFVTRTSTGSNPDGVSGPGTERRLLFKRVPALEEHLIGLRDLIEQLIEPPLDPGEMAVVVLTVPTPDEDVLAWVHVRDTSLDAPAEEDEMDVGDKPLPPKDAGLRWKMALDPVSPSILTEENDPIPAGTYPPPPEKQADGDIIAKGGGGLCATVTGRQGFLCRTRERNEDEAACEEEAPEPQERTIILSNCTPPDEDSSSSEGEGASRTLDICKQLRSGESSSPSASPCEPGSDASYPYTIMGHTCFIRECAERGYGHTLIPGREPFDSQESTLPWRQCKEDEEGKETLRLPATLTLPIFPAYNPGSRMKELLLEYCQQRGKPPLLPPSLCQTSAAGSVDLLSTLYAAIGFNLLREQNTLAQDEQLTAAEGMGLDVGVGIYREYLRRVSASLTGTIRVTAAVLSELASGVFPTTMCPLNPQDDLSLCTP